MDFEFTREQEAFREEVREFLRENPPERFESEVEDIGFGSGGASREFSRKLGERGWIALTWPKEYGGQGRPDTYRFILRHELAYHHAPFFAHSVAESLAPTMYTKGSDFMKRELLPGIARGEIYFWLGFSEPNAGSDMLSLQTRAVKDGDDYVITGQKVWSSIAQIAQYGYVMALTNPDVPRHQGLSAFLIKTDLPNVTVRPLLNLVGGHYHNEVFLDGVRVSKEFRLGKENEGFFMLLQGLEHDRLWGRAAKAPYCRHLLEQLIEYVKQSGLKRKRPAEYIMLRQQLAQSAIELEACDLLFYRAISMMEKGEHLTCEATMAKVFADEAGQRVFNLGMMILESYGNPKSDPEWVSLRRKVERLCMNSVGHTLAGGTSEIIRNTIATRGLGLPNK